MRSLAVPCRICGGPSARVAEYDITRLGGYWAKVNVPIPSVEYLTLRTVRLLLHIEGSRPRAHPRPVHELDWEAYYADVDSLPGAEGGSMPRKITRFVPRGSRVMDVGGGNGAFLVVAAMVFDSWLQELNPGRSERLTDAGVTVVPAYSEEAPEGTFDAVTLWDVYEHVWPHDLFLDPIKRALAPTGLLVLEVPSPTRLVPLQRLLGRLSHTPRRERSFSQICDFSHLQLMTPRRIASRATGARFRRSIPHVSLVELRGGGVCPTTDPSERLAKRVGSALTWCSIRQLSLATTRRSSSRDPRRADAAHRGERPREGLMKPFLSSVWTECQLMPDAGATAPVQIGDRRGGLVNSVAQATDHVPSISH